MSNEPPRIKIISVDPGLQNFCYVKADCNPDYTDLVFRHGQVVDLTQMHQTPEETLGCKLNHTNCTSPWIKHMLINHGKHFDECDLLLIELQPLGGLKDIEQLIFDKYEDKVKTILVPPRSMHKKFGVGFKHIPDLDVRREYRKKAVIKVAQRYLNAEMRTLLESYSHKEWKLDQMQHVADGVCLAVYMVEKLKAEQIKIEKDIDVKTKVINSVGITFQELTERFMFKAK